MPRVSVLMPAYNSAAFVVEAVESVLGQTFSDLELIVVDDGSVDGTPDALEGIRDARLQVLRHERNRGMGAALNSALAVASGELIATQDADDSSLPTRLASQVALFDRATGLVLAGSAAEIVDEHGAVRGFKRLPLTDTPIRWRALFASPFVQSSVMFRAEIARRHGLRYDEALRGGAEYPFLCSLLEHGSATNDPTALVRRRMHATQLTASARPEQIAEASAVTRENLRNLGIEVDVEGARRVATLHNTPPPRFGRDELASARLLVDVFRAFSARPQVDPGDVRTIRHGLVDMILVRGRREGWRALHESGVFALDPAWVVTSPLRWLVRRVRR